MKENTQGLIRDRGMPLHRKSLIASVYEKPIFEHGKAGKTASVYEKPIFEHGKVGKTASVYAKRTEDAIVGDSGESYHFSQSITNHSPA